MRFIGGDKEKEREQRQHRHEVVVADTANKALTKGSEMDRQLKDSMGKAFFLQQDENVVGLLRMVCPELLPAFSRMNATSKIEKPRDRRLMELHLEDILLHKEMELGDEEGVVFIKELGYIDMRSLIKSLRMFGIFRILDALGGYRGRLVTEEIERTTHVIEEPKKKRFW